jgi:hypothetical protein
MTRKFSAASLRAAVITLAFLASCFFSAAQVAPAVHLVSISAISSNGSPQAIFTFDTDIHTYSLSTYSMVTTSKGVTTSQPQAMLSLGAVPSTKVTIPLDFNALAGQDSVQVSVTLKDASGQTLITTPFYFLDLSFLTTIKGYQQQILGLQNDRSSLQTQLDQCQTDRKTLVQKQSASQFDYRGADLVAPTTAILHLVTDVYAAIRVTDTNSNTTINDVGIDHHIKFINLAPSTVHNFQASVLDASGQPITSLSKTFAITTPAFVSFAPTMKALATGPTTIVVTVDLDPALALPPGFKAYVKLHYKQQTDASTGTYGQVVDGGGDGGLDAFGVPTGTPYTSSHSFTLAVPQADQTYAITFTAYDQYGDVFDQAWPGAIIKVSPPPPALAFDGPISVTMNTNTGLTVNWKANRAVASTQMDVIFPDGTTVIPPIKKSPAQNSTDISVNTDLSGLTTILEKTLKAKTSPILKITMSDGTNAPNGSATVSLSVTFEVVANKQSSEPLQKAATNVAEAAQNPKQKINWLSVVQAGLGILVKVL